MNMFWFKRKLVVVDCFTTDPLAHRLYPVKNASAYFPEWWKSVPGRIATHVPRVENNSGIDIPMSTVRKCQGILELYQTGAIIPLWSDVIMTIVDGSYQYQFANQQTGIMSHDRAQHHPAFEKLVHGKMLSPWKFVEKTGVKFHYAPCVWSLLDKTTSIHGLPGVVDYKYQNSTHFNFMASGTHMNLTIDAGTPLVHIVPLTETDVTYKCHLIDGVEYNKKFAYNDLDSKFVGNYKEKKRCPFH